MIYSDGESMAAIPVSMAAVAASIAGKACVKGGFAVSMTINDGSAAAQ